MVAAPVRGDFNPTRLLCPTFGFAMGVATRFEIALVVTTGRLWPIEIAGTFSQLRRLLNSEPDTLTGDPATRIGFDIFATPLTGRRSPLAGPVLLLRADTGLVEDTGNIATGCARLPEETGAAPVATVSTTPVDV